MKIAFFSSSGIIRIPSQMIGFTPPNREMAVKQQITHSLLR
jgi:hypothetical protein